MKRDGTLEDLLQGTEEFVQKSTGMDLKLPRPKKRLLEISSLTNGIVGTSLVAFGLLTAHKWTIVVGAAGIASSIITNQESKQMK